MLAGYVALTEMTAEKELIVYCGNTPCPDMAFMGRFKLHLVPADIPYVTLITRDFITDEKETESLLSLDEALKTGFMQPVDLIGKDMELSRIKSLIARKPKIHRKIKKLVDKS